MDVWHAILALTDDHFFQKKKQKQKQQKPTVFQWVPRPIQFPLGPVDQLNVVAVVVAVVVVVVVAFWEGAATHFLDRYPSDSSVHRSTIASWPAKKKASYLVLPSFFF